MALGDELLARDALLFGEATRLLGPLRLGAFGRHALGLASFCFRALFTKGFAALCCFGRSALQHFGFLDGLADLLLGFALSLLCRQTLDLVGLALLLLGNPPLFLCFGLLRFVGFALFFLGLALGLLLLGAGCEFLGKCVRGAVVGRYGSCPCQRYTHGHCHERSASTHCHGLTCISAKKRH